MDPVCLPVKLTELTPVEPICAITHKPDPNCIVISKSSCCLTLPSYTGIDKLNKVTESRHKASSFLWKMWGGTVPRSQERMHETSRMGQSWTASLLLQCSSGCSSWVLYQFDTPSRGIHLCLADSEKPFLWKHLHSLGMCASLLGSSKDGDHVSGW